MGAMGAPCALPAEVVGEEGAGGCAAPASLRAARRALAASRGAARPRGGGALRLGVGGRVEWVCGGRVVRAYGAGGEGGAAAPLGPAGAVVDAAWCALGGSGGRLLCVLRAGAVVEVHAATGERWDAPLAAPADGMLPTPIGLLLTRSDGAAPRLLDHPLAEPREVDVAGAFAASTRASGIAASERAAAVRVVWASDEAPLAVCVDASRALVSICWLASEASDGAATGAAYALRSAWEAPLAASVGAGAADASAEADGFIAHGDSDERLLCVLIAGTLLAFELPTTEGAPLRDTFVRAGVRAAAPVVATRGDAGTGGSGDDDGENGSGVRDVLIADADGSLRLLAGTREVCEVVLPDVPNGVEVVSLSAGCYDRVSVGLGDGRHLRIELPFVPATAPARALLQCARGSLPSAQASALDAAVVRVLGGASPSPWPRTTSAELEAVRVCVLSAAGIDLSADDTHGVSGASPMAGDAAWQSLLRSHTHASATDAWAFAALRLPKATPGASSGKAGRSSLRRTAAAAESVRDTIAPEVLLVSLHAAYEDHKLDTLRHPALPVFARMLATLAARVGARARAYSEHYARDQPAAAARGAAEANAGESAGGDGDELPPPFDVFGRLEETLGTASAGQHVALRAALPHAVVHGGRGTAWTRDVLSFYERIGADDPTIGNGSGAAEADAVPLPLLMTARGFGLTQIGRLPVGVALPLQQDLQRWRASPPPGWPRAVYVLLGREDLAANASDAAEGDAADGRVDALHSLPYTLRPRARDGALTQLAGVLEDDHASNSLGDAGASAAVAGAAGAVSEDADDAADADGMAHMYGAASAQAGEDVGAGSGEGARTSRHAHSGASAYRSLGLRFRRDLRILEVRRLLSSATARAVRVDSGGGDSAAPDLVAAQQDRLLALAHRTAAGPLGRGAFTLATASIAPTESLPIPSLVYDGRLPSQQNAKITLDPNAGAAGGAAATNAAATAAAIGELDGWPHFHNGVAAGLCFAPWAGAHDGADASGGRAGGDAGPPNPVTRSWIVYNKPPEPSYAHAGLLMALGLTGQLSVLSATDAFRYLSQEHDATAVGVLLGMGAARKGSMDPAVSKMLLLHVPARHPNTYPDLELSPLVQAAALVALGLLYQGSAHRLMTEVMLREIGRKPGADGGRGREGYALAAGLALGLVALAKGRSAAGIADLRVEDRLRRYMVGGHDERPSASSATRSAGGAAIATGGMWGTGAEGSHAPTITHGPGVAEVYSPMASSGVGGSAASAGGQNSSADYDDGGAGVSNGQVMEGAMVNLDVSSPGATLALGLMFLKTNDAAVARRLSVPASHFQLDYVRPDFVLLRVLARGLVLWDSVQPTQAWVEGNLPTLVARWAHEAGFGPSPEPAAPGGAASEANADCVCDSDDDIDVEALGQTHASVLAGACLALGIRFAGTACGAAARTLTSYLEYFLKRKADTPAAAAGVAPRVGTDRATIECCISTCALALGVVMSGTGDLATLRVLRRLRRRLDAPGLTYGDHCAASTAIGFLFLGGGRMTFGRGDRQIAALVCALYPRMPSSPGDNRCHLQALRHLYVLAAQPRSIEALDVDTGEAVYAPIEILLHSGATLKRVAPCQLPDTDLVASVRVLGPRHLPQSVAFSAGCPPAGHALRRGVVYVKRRTGATTYEADPLGTRSLAARAPGENGAGEALVAAFSSNPSLQQHALILAGGADGGPFAEFAAAALYDCAAGEKPLALYLGLYHAACALALSEEAEGAHVGPSGTRGPCVLHCGPAGPALALWQIRLARTHARLLAARGEGSSALVRLGLLEGLHESVMGVLRSWAAKPQTVAEFVRGGTASFGEGARAAHFGAAASYLGLPSSQSALRIALEASRAVGAVGDAALPALAAALPGVPLDALRVLAAA